MKSLLKTLSEKAIELKDFEFSPEQIETKWLGSSPADEDAIKVAEKKLDIELPSDYKDFLGLTNGFDAPVDYEPSFLSVDQIDFLKNVNPVIIDAFSSDENKNIGVQLERSIIVAGMGEEQYFLLIPPSEDNPKWGYWKFANWIPGEEEYANLMSYFELVLGFIDEVLSEEEGAS